MCYTIRCQNRQLQKHHLHHRISSTFHFAKKDETFLCFCFSFHIYLDLWTQSLVFELNRFLGRKHTPILNTSSLKDSYIYAICIFVLFFGQGWWLNTQEIHGKHTNSWNMWNMISYFKHTKDILIYIWCHDQITFANTIANFHVPDNQMCVNCMSYKDSIRVDR